ncbi:MAG: DUF2867 domain-containing protein [Geodermatophilaceae bacterium]|nr:DUF2867 domain-containing protein [Geodermatophilaceae bacterium]
MRCLVLGATGYVGTRLVGRLLADGHWVRCLVRDPERARISGWGDQVELMVGDIADGATLDKACDEIDALYYLVHGMDGAAGRKPGGRVGWGQDRPGFTIRDRSAALAVAGSARRIGVSQIIYLSGLQPPDGEPVSPHLASRHEVGELLLASGVPTAVLQAGVILGSGSAGFEMIRHLAESLPVLPMPARMDCLVQPIGIDDALHYLVACLALPTGTNRTFDIGGPDVVSYRELSARYARTAGLGAYVTVRVPEARTAWTALAVEALTPVDRHLAGPLLDSMSHNMVCRENDHAGKLGLPPGGPTTVDVALHRALEQVGPAGARPNDPVGSGPTVLHSQHVLVAAVPTQRVWQVLGSMGGGRGWNTLPGVWAARGWLDGLLGGIGNRTIAPRQLIPGATWDTWRIEAVEAGTSVLLRSEMRLPGKALLKLSVHPLPDGRSRYVQRVTFQPSGWLGRAYWYAQLPAHQLVFGVMASTIVWRAEQGLLPAGHVATGSPPPDPRPRS